MLDITLLNDGFHIVTETEGGDTITYRICERLDVIAHAYDDKNNIHGKVIKFKNRLKQEFLITVPMTVFSGSALPLWREFLRYGFVPPFESQEKKALAGFLHDSNPKETIKTSFHPFRNECSVKEVKGDKDGN